MLLYLSGFILSGGIQSICSNRRTVQGFLPRMAQTPPAGLNGARIGDNWNRRKGLAQLIGSEFSAPAQPTAIGQRIFTLRHLTKLLSICTVAAFLAVPAKANEQKFQLGSGITVRYYGWFSFANQSIDDGVTTTSNIVDYSGSGSRFGFFIEPVEGGGPLSFQFETGLGFRPSQKTSQTNTPDSWDWGRKDLRHVQLILTTGIGTFRLGQGSMTTDGEAEADLGGTVVVAKSTIPESHGAFQFRTTGGALSGITIANTFNNFDGARRFRLRFDTKSYSGFSLAAAYGQEVLTSGNTDEFYDVSLSYQGTVGDFNIVGAIGTSYTKTAISTNHNTLGSVAVLHKPTGLNLSVAAGQASNNGGSYVYLKGGWTADLISAGHTKFILEGLSGNDYLTSASRSDMWGVALIQNFDTQNLEVYAGYRGFSYDDATALAYQDIGALQIGARWRF